MKKLVLIAIILVIGWYGNYLYRQNGSMFTQQSITDEGALTVMLSQNSGKKVVNSSFKCDGRTHCSQMASCEEATFFLRNCPNVKMDGDNDGIPCEQQWCN